MGHMEIEEQGHHEVLHKIFPAPEVLLKPFPRLQIGVAAGRLYPVCPVAVQHQTPQYPGRQRIISLNGIQYVDAAEHIQDQFLRARGQNTLNIHAARQNGCPLHPPLDIRLALRQILQSQPHQPNPVGKGKPPVLHHVNAPLPDRGKPQGNGFIRDRADASVLPLEQGGGAKLHALRQIPQQSENPLAAGGQRPLQVTRQHVPLPPGVALADKGQRLVALLDLQPAQAPLLEEGAHAAAHVKLSVIEGIIT